MYKDPDDRLNYQYYLDTRVKEYRLTEAEVPGLTTAASLFCAKDIAVYCDYVASLMKKIDSEFANRGRPAANGEFVMFPQTGNQQQIGRIEDVTTQNNTQTYVLRMNFEHDQRRQEPELVHIPVADCRYLDVVLDSCHPMYVDCSVCW